MYKAHAHSTWTFFDRTMANFPSRTWRYSPRRFLFDERSISLVIMEDLQDAWRFSFVQNSLNRSILYAVCLHSSRHTRFSYLIVDDSWFGARVVVLIVHKISWKGPEKITQAQSFYISFLCGEHSCKRMLQCTLNNGTHVFGLQSDTNSFSE